jgi:hypothetical protein
VPHKARKPQPRSNADDPAEYQRFLDVAREVGADETPGALGRALDKVVRPKEVKPSASQSRRNGKQERS